MRKSRQKKHLGEKLINYVNVVILLTSFIAIFPLLIWTLAELLYFRDNTQALIFAVITALLVYINSKARGE
jgi:hypothetical protein